MRGINRQEKEGAQSIHWEPSSFLFPKFAETGLVRFAEFADGLATRTDLPIEFQDERYTTVISDRTMNETGQSDHKKYVDEIAAMLILQSYMDREKNISNGN